MPFNGSGYLWWFYGFALRRLQKEMLELTVNQKEALESILCGSHVLTLKKHVNTRNRISQRCAFWRQHSQLLSGRSTLNGSSAIQTLFSSDGQLHSCHKGFSHYRQPPSLHQSVLIYFWAICSSKCESAYVSPSRPSYVWSSPTTL